MSAGAPVFCTLQRVLGLPEMQVRVLPPSREMFNLKVSDMEKNKVYLGDCLYVMRQMEDRSLDIILTSPPYNKSRNSHSERALANLEVHYKDFDDAKSNEEYIKWTLERFVEFGRTLKDDGVICYNMSYATDEIRMAELMWLVVAEVIKQGIFTLGDCIIWKKKNATPNNVSPNKMTRICEFVFVFCKRGSFDTYRSNKKLLSTSKTGQKIYEDYRNIIEAENNDGPCEIHKATYSTSLCFQLLDRYGVSGGLVYDPFMGTGTTAIAAMEWGMDFVGSEISQEYVDYANERIRIWVSEPKMF